MENANIFIEKERPMLENKELFYEVMGQRVQRLRGNSYTEMAGENSSMAHFGGVVCKVPEGKLIKDAVIYVNEDDFFVKGEDFTDIIPVVLRHEMFELWTYVKNGWSLSPAPKRIGNENRVSVAHGLALREEYRYAVEIGKAERYLEYIKKWSQEHPRENMEGFISENENAYKKVISRTGETDK
ncbi:MAG: hypothetical protein NTZ13_01770 [Candidatus Parcubacteria bacterium]|nr:hypothetical protein [Candidatus Parcubacteria bacterium]